MWLRSQVQSRSERTYILYFENLWTQNFDLLLHHILVLFWKNHTTTRHHDHRKPPRNWWPSWPRDLLSSALPDGKSNFFQMSHWVKNLTKLCAIIMSILFYARNRRAEISAPKQSLCQFCFMRETDVPKFQDSLKLIQLGKAFHLFVWC